MVLIVFSFNNSKNRAVWHGFTTKWYSDLFHNDLILDSLKLTLLVAFLAGDYRHRDRYGRRCGHVRYERQAA